jgi:predicted phage terminase large subunit-like protein
MVAWHIKELGELLDEIEKGNIRFAMVEEPPRHSKSLNVSQLFPAYFVGKDRNRSVIVASYSGELATDHGRETRNLIATQRYQNIFDTKLASDSNAKGRWNTNGKGAYTAAGAGGSITGKGADLFVVDDPYKDRKEADSQIIREDRWAWLRSVARTRLTPTGAMLITHTRWHEDDMIGRLTNPKSEYKEEYVTWWEYKQGKRAKWVLLSLPAIAIEDEEHRKVGEPLWPERYGVEELEDIKKSLGPYEFSALYQQNPVDDASREFKTEWFKTRTMDEISKMTVRRFATIDPNLKKSDQSDYCGVVRNYVNSDGQWNLKATRYRVNSKEVIDLVFLLHDEGFEKIGIEEGAFSYVVEPFLQEEMRKRGKFPNVVPLKHNQTMKETRIRGLIPWFAGHMVYLIEGECDDLESELLAFPKGTHDDVADACAYQIQLAEPPASERAMLLMEEREAQHAANVANRLGV